VTDHGDRIGFTVGQGASERGVNAEHRVIVAGDGLHERELRLAGDAHVGVRDRTECGQPGQHGAAAVAAGQGRGRAGREGEHVAGGAVLAEDDQPARVGHRQRAQEHGVGEREDGGVGADAERERHHRDGGEQRIAAQAAHGVAQVASEVVEPRQAALVADRVEALRQGAAPHDGRAARIGRRRIAAARVLGRQLEMRAQFLGDVGVAPGRSQRAPQSPAPLAQPRHRLAPLDNLLEYHRSIR
jgi:hypothetical protein